jgi:hypothetical protein
MEIYRGFSERVQGFPTMGFWGLRFSIRDLGFRVFQQRVWGLRFSIRVLGFRVFQQRVLGF